MTRPRFLQRPRSIRRLKAPDSEYYHTTSAATAKLLADIRQTDRVDKVMLNGRLYEAATLDETVTGERRTQPFYWQQ